MKKIPCELTLGNGGDVIAMVPLDDDGTLRVPRHSTYGSCKEGVIAYRIMNPADREMVKIEIWQEDE